MDQSRTPLPGWHCPAESALDLLSGKWRPMIIFWLMDGPLRFNELQRRLGGITHRTLSKTLKEMEAGGLITRNDYGEIPPRVEYALTEKGRAALPSIEALRAYGARYLNDSCSELFRSMISASRSLFSSPSAAVRCRTRSSS